MLVTDLGYSQRPLESADMQTVDFQSAAETCVLASLQQPQAGWFANQSAVQRMMVDSVSQPPLKKREALEPEFLKHAGQSVHVRETSPPNTLLCIGGRDRECLEEDGLYLVP